MIKLDAIETFEASEEGMTIKQGNNEVFLTWDAIEKFGEEVSPMLFRRALKQVQLTEEGWEQLKIMQQQKTIN